ncbi:UDP-glucuronosyltransferase 2C1-like [Ptychodera flava]|uniref:UDP-glucuronosyltransferase 2C1-like n=1 Tax=Ptychodera flava TaxID=63121 RepID=UPI00396A7C21
MASSHRMLSYMPHGLFNLFVTFCVLFVRDVSCYKILFLPALSTGSHYMYLAKIGEQLVHSGHNVTFLLGHYNDLRKNADHERLFKVENYHTELDEDHFTKIKTTFISRALRGQQRFEDAKLMSAPMLEDCKMLLRDIELFKRLETSKFDLVVLDNVAACSTLIAQKLVLPFVIASTNRPVPQVDANYLAIPTPISYVPALQSGLSDQMTFVQRLQNLLMNVVVFYMFNFVMLKPYEELKQQYNIQPHKTVQESLAGAEVALFGVDWALEFPRPYMPNTVFIGGLLAKEPSPLKDEWKEFVDSADDGIVVFSFGGYANLAVDPEKAEIVTAALARLPQKVVMRYEGQPPKSLGKNTKLAEWIPQNDLLGHPKTKAFVTHGGINGVYEAIFHGVPVVGIPLYGDHYDNFVRLSKKGMAVTLNVVTMTSAELHQAINMIIREPRYKENAMQLSRIHRDKPMPPVDTAVFWIEHVIKHGGQHLRAEAVNLNFVQYFSLDVMAFLLVCLVLSIFLLKRVSSFVLGLCCKRSPRKEKIN